MHYLYNLYDMNNLIWLRWNFKLNTYKLLCIYNYLWSGLSIGGAPVGQYRFVMSLYSTFYACLLCTTSYNNHITNKTFLNQCIFQMNVLFAQNDWHMYKDKLRSHRINYIASGIRGLILFLIALNKTGEKQSQSEIHVFCLQKKSPHSPLQNFQNIWKQAQNI